jgi:hypothetical protein
VLTGLWRTGRFFREQVAGSLGSLVRQPNYVEGWGRLLSEQARAGSAELLRDPGYESQLGSLYLVQVDMQRVLDLVATRERPVVVFVDDLDRCSPGTVAQVIEAINLFLAGQYPNCIFVIAMEPDVVAAHIEVAYGPLVAGLTAGSYWGRPEPLGWRFLDKIVQLPLSLPALSPTRASQFLGGVLAGAQDNDGGADGEVDAGQVRRLEEAIQRQQPSIEQIPQAAARAQAELAGAPTTVDRLSPEARAAMRQALGRRLRPDDPEVKAIVAAVADRLNRNPREMKRFVNVFRFYAVIRQEREVAGLSAADDLMQIAKLAVLAVRWPQLRSALSRQIGAAEGETVLALLEAPIVGLDDNAGWPVYREALEQVLIDSHVPEKLRADLLGARDLCRLLRSGPAIGAAAAGYL